MPTIRRLYLYAVAFTSLETVLWGAIRLVRLILLGSLVEAQTGQLAGALSLILVGVPVFLLHWLPAQRSAAQDEAERFTRIRSLFLYGALLATLVPIVQNILAILNRSLTILFGLNAGLALVGGGQSFLDNIAAVLLNALAAAYFFFVLSDNWQISETSPEVEGVAQPGDHFLEMRRMLLIRRMVLIRRLYRYIWQVYGLGLAVLGAQQVLQFLLLLPLGTGGASLVLFANGLALLLIGVPLWYFASQVIQRTLLAAAEKQSVLRLGVLYLLALFSMSAVLASAELTLEAALRVVLGESLGLSQFLANVAVPLSSAVPLSAVWAYYGRRLNLETSLRAEQAAVQEEDQLQRVTLRRLYVYILSFLGLGAAFVGLQLLFAFLVDAIINPGAIFGASQRSQLARALADFLVGVSLWAYTWRQALAEISAPGEAGDHARRSIVRKGYLFLVLFAGVTGTIFTAGGLLNLSINAALGNVPEDLLLQVLQRSRLFLLFALLSGFHWIILRADNRLVERSLSRRHAQFPVLVLAPGGGVQPTETEPPTRESAPEDETGFASAVVDALHRQAPSLPVAVHPAAQGAPDPTLSAARAVILTAELAARPSEALRLWLQAYDGARIVIPTTTPELTPVSHWYWVFGGAGSLASRANQAARIVRHLAEGEQERASRQSAPWAIAVYVFAALFALELIAGLLALGASLILR
jgi:hypothetical protein